MSKEKTPSSETSAETSPIKLETWRDLWARFVNNRYVSIGTTVILLAVFLWIGARFYLSSQNEEALREMRYAEEYFRQDSFEKALKGSISFMGFEQLAREYRWTKAGNLCRLYQGLCHLKLGQYEAGLSYELAGEYKNAARVYRRLLARYPLAGEAPTAQKHLARVEAYAP
jgi:tetratricopeptide (TPR) repeat protein